MLPKNNAGKYNLLVRNFPLNNWLSGKPQSLFFGSSNLGDQYPDFKIFSTDEIMQHLDIYLLNGLYPSTRIEMKFKTSEEYLVNNNDLCYTIYGGSYAGHRHKEFKWFFASVNPMVPNSPTTTHQNWKVGTLLKHTTCASKSSIVVGKKYIFRWKIHWISRAT